MIEGGSKVLDVGCGSRILSFYLIQKNCSVVGVDISREAVNKARERNVNALVLDIEKMNYLLKRKSLITQFA